jgi:hypothetical protein
MPGVMIDIVRQRVSGLPPSELVEVRVSELCEFLTAVEGVELDRDRWAARVKQLEQRLRTVVEVASGVQPGVFHR